MRIIWIFCIRSSWLTRRYLQGILKVCPKRKYYQVLLKVETYSCFLWRWTGSSVERASRSVSSEILELVSDIKQRNLLTFFSRQGVEQLCMSLKEVWFSFGSARSKETAPRRNPKTAQIRSQSSSLNSTRNSTSSSTRKRGRLLASSAAAALAKE